MSTYSIFPVPLDGELYLQISYLLFVAVLDDVGDVLENIDIIEKQKVPSLFCS